MSGFLAPTCVTVLLIDDCGILNFPSLVVVYSKMNLEDMKNSSTTWHYNPDA